MVLLFISTSYGTSYGLPMLHVSLLEKYDTLQSIFGNVYWRQG